MEQYEKIGIVLLNMGGPDSLDAVRPFLYNLFSDPDILKLPFSFLMQKPLAKFISNRRAPKSIELYRQIGGGSPILKLTQEQAQKLEEKLSQSNIKSKVFIAMRYWHPFTEEAVQQILENNITHLVVLTLYPHYSSATTGSSIKELKRVLQKFNVDLKLIFIESWYDHPAYINALTENIEIELAHFPENHQKKVQVIFSAHNLPQKLIDQGDPYLKQIQATIRGILERLDNIHWHLSFQSRTGPVKWMEPNTEDIIKKLACEGCKDILMVPLSFVSDHVETLYEIDILYRQQAEAMGIKNFRRIPSLNSSAMFIEALTQIVTEHLSDLDKK